jgi:hypothetical protein
MQDGTSVLSREGIRSTAEEPMPSDRPTGTKCLFVTFGACRAGKENLRRIVERFGHDTFDYLLFIYDDSRYDDDCFARCRIIYDQSPPFWRLKRFVTPELCRRYEYVFLWVDDLDILDFDPQNFLRILRTHRLEVAQPALAPGSVIYHPITARQNQPIGRYTDFVEEMVFAFRGDLWERFWHMITPDDNPWGWGYDELAYSVGRFRRMAVIDAEVVKHLHKGTYHAEALAGRARTHKRFQRFYFPKKRVLCPIADTPLHKHLTTPLRLNAHFLFAWFHSLPGIARLRPFLRARLHPTPIAPPHGQA